MSNSGKGQRFFTAMAVYLYQEYIESGRKRVKADDLMARSDPFHRLACPYFWLGHRGVALRTKLIVS